MGILEGTGVGIKIGTSDGELPGFRLGAGYRSKLGGDSVSGSVLSGGTFEGDRDLNLEGERN